MIQHTQSTSAPVVKKVRHQQKIGRVLSNKMNKTVVVAVESLKRHRIYKRTYRQTKHFYAHDEQNTCQVGDMVRIEETRPISKLKRWRVVEILKLGSGIVPVAELMAGVDPDLSGKQRDEVEEPNAESEEA
ncbi:MAG: 30S ribosomal protein S17 [Ktedonobacteraceae bacterium]|nr:30S ribosomal protein S17 [Chloroflexota bacterium]